MYKKCYCHNSKNEFYYPLGKDNLFYAWKSGFKLYMEFSSVLKHDDIINTNSFFIYKIKEMTKIKWQLKISTFTSLFSQHSGGTPGLSVTDSCF